MKSFIIIRDSIKNHNYINLKIEYKIIYKFMRQNN